MQKEINKSTFQCRLCNSKDISLKYEFDSCKVGFCKDCGFIQVLVKPTNEELFKIYDSEYFKRGKYVQDKAIDLENKRRIDWLFKNGIKKGARVLDVGCATGDFIKVSEDKFDIWGLDISEFAVNQARLNNPHVSDKIRAGKIEDQDFPDNFFDAICLWDVIEHLWDPKETVTKLARMLKPGGILAISTPNIGALTARIMGKHWHFMTVPEHLSFFSKSTINSLFKTTGLTCVNWMTKGKWVNVNFLLHKFNKTFPNLIPGRLLKWLQQKRKISNIILYIPTGDIQYIIVSYLKNN